jgi:hypothetical protein
VHNGESCGIRARFLNWRPAVPACLKIATMTLARTTAEVATLSTALPKLFAHGWPAVVADAASVPSFRESLRQHRDVAVVEPDAPGLVGQIRTALHAAGNGGQDGFILYTEPDKATFFERHLAGFVGAAPRHSDVGIVLAARSEEAFGTFPPAQRVAETAINRLCSQMIGVDTDYSYGPFLINRALIPFVSQLGADVGWGWRHFVFGMAARQRLRVLHITGDFECPPEQRCEDHHDRLHRMRQLQQNVHGLLLSQQ